MSNLRKAGIRSLKDITKNKRKLAQLIRPCGFYQQKVKYLFNLAKFITQSKNFSRTELLAQKGVGPETADSILLYALEKPVFVIDEYTRRLVAKLKLTNNFSYLHLQQLFEKNLKKDYKLYQDFHALIVIDGKARV